MRGVESAGVSTLVESVGPSGALRPVTGQLVRLSLLIAIAILLLITAGCG